MVPHDSKHLLDLCLKLDDFLGASLYSHVANLEHLVHKGLVSRALAQLSGSKRFNGDWKVMLYDEGSIYNLRVEWICGQLVELIGAQLVVRSLIPSLRRVPKNYKKFLGAPPLTSRFSCLD
jgi:hypothetical protein